MSPVIDQHPDLVALRAQSERAAATPTGQAVECLSLLTGLYLAASPWIVGFNGLTTLAVNNLIAGLAFAYLAMGLGNAYERTHGMSWAAAGIGVWTIIAPGMVAGDVSTTSTIVSNVLTGIVAVLLALATAGMGAPRRRI
ncbi:SPW repeat protein [Streptomyces sp. KR80]|uniref:SPW repeat protein n=1 Tax=Streptomyces sp. KR80 TaxID=3457426 RepID=UPI003FD6BE55